MVQTVEKGLGTKLLGRNISLNVMQQRLYGLWKMENGFQLIYVDGEVFIARFYTRDDYFRVLEKGPWIVLGHYLSVRKWNLNLKSSLEEVSSTQFG